MIKFMYPNHKQHKNKARVMIQKYDIKHKDYSHFLGVFSQLGFSGIMKKLGFYKGEGNSARIHDAAVPYVPADNHVHILVHTQRRNCHPWRKLFQERIVPVSRKCVLQLEGFADKYRH